MSVEHRITLLKGGHRKLYLEVASDAADDNDMS